MLLLFLLLVRKGLTMHRLVKADNLIASYSAFHNLEVFDKKTNLTRFPVILLAKYVYLLGFLQPMH